jgi:hypothetical protein
MKYSMSPNTAIAADGVLMAIPSSLRRLVKQLRAKIFFIIPLPINAFLYRSSGGAVFKDRFAKIFQALKFSVVRQTAEHGKLTAAFNFRPRDIGPIHFFIYFFPSLKFIIPSIISMTSGRPFKTRVMANSITHASARTDPSYSRK